MSIIPTYQKKQEYGLSCEECGEPLVRFLDGWLCKHCIKVPIAHPGGRQEMIVFNEVYPNRAARRAAEKELRSKR